MKIIARIGLLFLVSSSLLHAEPPANFNQAKITAKKIFQDHRITLYCNCEYDERHQINLASCKMQQASEKKRALRVEFEHMTPAETFGRQLPCWREPLCTDARGKPYKGRRCCSKIDPRFRKMEAELYNLWPAEGLVNQARSNYRYALVGTSENFYGCTIQIDKSHRRVEPDEQIKGLVARASLFMSDLYQLKLSDAQRKLFIAWDRLYPPSAWEKQWAQRVAEKEGYKNPYIEKYA